MTHIDFANVEYLQAFAEKLFSARSRILAQVSSRQFVVQTCDDVGRMVKEIDRLSVGDLVEQYLRLVLVLDLSLAATGLTEREVADIAFNAKTLLFQIKQSLAADATNWLSAMLEVAMSKSVVGEWAQIAKAQKVGRLCFEGTTPSYCQIVKAEKQLNDFDVTTAKQIFAKLLSTGESSFFGIRAAIGHLQCLRFAGEHQKWREDLEKLRRQFEHNEDALPLFDWEDIFGGACIDGRVDGLRLATSSKRPHRRLLPLLLSRLILITRGDENAASEIPRERVIKKLLLREVFDVDAWQRCLPALAAMQFILCLPKDSLSNIPVEELAGNLDLVEAAPNIEFRVLYLGAFAQHLSQTDHNDFATKLKDAYNERSRKLSLGKSGDLYRIFERVAEPSLVMQERDFNWLSQTVLAGSFAVRAAATRARAKISTRINPSRSQDHREREILQYAALVRSHLAFAKGPLTKFVQALPFLEAMLPPKIAAELRSLEEQPRALDGTVAQAIVESELGLPINQLFAEWHSTPIAAASLGQVHRARLKDGRVVAVKVQFPQLRTLLSRQVSAMKIIAPAVGAIFSSVDT